METETIHFRIGEDFGVLLTSIAQEHLTERNNPVQALKTITESLHGCPTDMAVLILKGDIVLLVDEETQQVLPTKRTPALDKIFPKIDPLYFLESRAKNIKMHGDNLVEAFRVLQSQISKDRGYLTVDFKYEDIFKFIAGDNEILLEELRDNREVDGIGSLFETAKRFIEETMKTQSTMDWVMQTFDDFKKSQNYEYYMQLRGDVADTLIDIAYHLNQTLKLDFVIDGAYITEDNVQKYIDAAREIDEVMSKGIQPVDIMDNYSAGWLSPEGVYYALNGEIANMLHNQIADALQEAGVIPEDEVNPDSWLEQHGWVKIHGNNVQYAGNLNVRLEKPIVHITEKQIEIIRDYITNCHACEIKAGWRLERTSIGMFTMLAMKDKLALYKKYFDF